MKFGVMKEHDSREYPANLSPHDAVIGRQLSQAFAKHAAVPYSTDTLSGPVLGPANPSNIVRKRKNVLTGNAEETFLSEHSFRTKHRAAECRGGPTGQITSGRFAKDEASRFRANRQKKGSAAIVEGVGSYIGPWAKHSKNESEITTEVNLEMEDDMIHEDEEIVRSGTVVEAPVVGITRRREVQELGDETSTFHGLAELDYQGRTYMHVPQDLGIDLCKDGGFITNYIPKKQVHSWRDHSKAVTALRFFPGSGHLLLSASSDTTIKIRDVYHGRALLRTYSGHSKAISDVCFNTSGSQFLSSSYDRMIKLWDTETGSCVGKFTTGKTPHVIKFNPSPEHATEFLAGMSDKKIVQFDARTPGRPVQEYDHHLAAINTITFVDHNRRFMTTSDDKSLRAWDYNIPVPIKYIAEPDMYPMTNATLHPSGKYVAYQSSDNQILVYGANDKFRQNRKKSYRGHNNAGLAIGLDCSPDGQFLASGDSGGYVCFWDWKTCKMYHKMKAGSQAITCVKWHPQETSKVATAGLEGEIRYWD